MIGILIGSSSDLPATEKGLEFLKSLGVNYQISIASAHRDPGLVEERIQEWEKAGVQVWVAGAGGAAHLAGAIASRTLLPVIGVPFTGTPLHGMDALLSTVQMPPGIPVATVGIDNFLNACFLACQILALSDPSLLQKLKAYREEKRKQLRSTSV